MNRLSILLVTLLLSASPALADDYLYLECDTKFSVINKDLRANQIWREEDVDIFHSKVDLVNSQILAAKGEPEWKELQIVDGVYVFNEEELKHGVATSMSLSLQVDPPRQITVNVLALDGDYSRTTKMTGMCKEVDASVFEKALKETES